MGGWRQYGIDPGQFSFRLMQSCERLVTSGYFASNQPARLLAQGFSEMQQCKKPVIGSSTACVAMLSHADGKVRYENECIYTNTQGFLYPISNKITFNIQNIFEL